LQPVLRRSRPRTWTEQGEEESEHGCTWKVEIAQRKVPILPTNPRLNWTDEQKSKHAAESGTCYRCGQPPCVGPNLVSVKADVGKAEAVGCAASSTVVGLCSIVSVMASPRRVGG